MKIPLRHFEQLIDPTILKRGLAYFQKDLVDPVGEGDDGESLFIVHGSEDYEISLYLDGESIEDFICECPYMDGPVCKHIVAVIFYLTQDDLQLNEPISPVTNKKKARGRPKARSKSIPDEPQLNEPISPATNKKKARGRPKARSNASPQALPANELLHQDLSEVQTNFRTKRPSAVLNQPGKTKVSVKTQIKEIIQQITAEELKEFVLEQLLYDKKQQADFLSYFAGKNQYESIDTYRSKIKSILSAAKDRHGFIDYRSVGKVGMEVDSIAFNGLRHCEQGNDRSAMLISFAVLEEMTKALQFADDSGELGSSLEMAVGTLTVLSKKRLAPEIRKQFFDYAIEKYLAQEFEDWDWHLGMIELASNMVQNEDDITLLIQLLNRKPWSEYDRELRQNIMYGLLLKKKDKTDAQKFLEHHLDNTDFRTIALQNAFENSDFAQVKKLAQAAIESHKKSKPGLLSDWYDWLIKTADAEGDTSKLLEYTRLQLLHHGREKEPYYLLLRTNTPSSQWPDVYVQLIKEMSHSSDWRAKEFVPEVLVMEQDWNNLLGYLQHLASTRGLHFQQLVHYGSHLLTSHHAAIGDLLKQAVLASARSASNRRDYANVAKELRQMKKMGYGEMVRLMVSDFMRDYRQRPAMVEELGKV